MGSSDPKCVALFRKANAGGVILVEPGNDLYEIIQAYVREAIKKEGHFVCRIEIPCKFCSVLLP